MLERGRRARMDNGNADVGQRPPLVVGKAG